MSTYKLLKKIADEDNRSAGMQITHLVEKEAKIVKMKPEVKDSGAEPTNGTSDA